MAQARKATKVVEQVVTTEEEVVVLELTLAEAAALKCVSQKIGGCPDTSIRKYTDSIDSALYDIGICSQNGGLCDGRGDSIYFKDGTIKDLII